MIRRANLTDLNDLIALEKEVFGDSAYTRDIIIKNLMNKNIYNYVSDINNRIVGYISIFYFEDEANLLKIGVLEEYRIQGIGKALYNYAVDVLRQIGMNHIYLEVRASNHIAINFYKKLGFKIQGVRQNYYKDEDAIVLYM